MLVGLCVSDKGCVNGCVSVCVCARACVSGRVCQHYLVCVHACECESVKVHFRVCVLVCVDKFGYVLLEARVCWQEKQRMCLVTASAFSHSF